MSICPQQTHFDHRNGPGHCLCQSELCACYHNGFQLGSALFEVADDDFISCWLAEEDTSTGVSELRAMACDGSNQPRLSSRAWARS